MMLWAYEHSRDPAILRKWALPWCESLLRFYDLHYPKHPNGTIFLQHAQSCETWPDCTNPAAQVAALHRIGQALVALPPGLVTGGQRAFFARIASSLPAIPLTTASNGQLQVSPCAGGFPQRHVNGENVETYAIWPYEYFATNRSAAIEAAFPLAVGANTFANVHFGHGNSAWRYDGQDAALLGQADYAWDFLQQRVLHQGHCDASRFRGYLASDAGDGAPQVESNGIVAATLQKMLLQTDGSRILLFPAFVRGVDVDLQLRVPGFGGERESAVLRVVTKAGEISFLGVTPESRRRDVVVLELQ